MSAAEADPVSAAIAVSTSAIFFIFNSSDGCACTDSRNPLSRLYAVPPKMLLRQQHTRPKTTRGKTPAKRAFSASVGPIRRQSKQDRNRYHSSDNEGRIGG